jgi:hypothetical protein
MDPRSSVRKRVDECFDIVDIAGQNRFRKFDRDGHQVGVDNVSGARAGEDRTDNAAVGERMNGDCRQESCETGLAAPVTPHLRDNRVRCVQRSASLERCVQELVSGAFTAVDRHQKSGVENHSS